MLAGYLLAFQETPKSRKSQEVPEIILVKSSGGFLHIRKSPESVENFVMAFRAFPGIPGKPGEPGHSWLFQAFSWLFRICKKASKTKNFTPEFRAPFCRGLEHIKKNSNIILSTKNNSFHGTLFLPLVKEQRFKLGLFNDGKGVINNRQKLLKRNYCHFNSKIACYEAT